MTDKEGSSHGSLQSLWLASIGFALYWIWIWAVNRSWLSGIGAVGDDALIGGIVSNVAMAVALAAFIVALRFAEEHATVAFMVVAVVCGTIGFVVIGPLAYFESGLASPSLLIGGWVMVGLGSGACSFLWAAVLFSVENIEGRLRLLMATTVVASLLYLCCTFFEQTFFVVLVTCVPLMSVSLFWPLRKCVLSLRHHRAAWRRSTRITMARIYVALFAFGVGFGFILVMAFQGVGSVNVNRISFAVVGVASLAVVAVLPRLKVSNIFPVYRLITPAILIGFLSIPLAVELSDFRISAIIINIGWRAFEICSFLILVDAIDRLNLAQLRSFGLGRLLTVVGVVLGQASGYALAQVGVDNTSVLIVASSVLSIVFLIVSLFVLDYQGFVQADRFYSGRNNVGETDGRTPQETTLEEQCRKIAHMYGLTPREAEIFELLARGRDARYIREKLFISNSTVKVHRYNIYKKLDVHSRQELLSFIEQGL